MWSFTTDTFRRSSRKILGKQGSNLQNQSDEVSRIYLPDEGKVFIQADQSGADAFIVSYLLPPGNRLREMFLNNVKPHSYLALHLFKKEWWEEGLKELIDLYSLSIKELSVHPQWLKFNKMVKEPQNFERYFIGKKTCHSLNYRMQVNTFIFDVLKESEGKIALTKQEGQKFYDIYHNLIKELQEWYKELDETLRQTRTLRNLFGYPRYFDGPLSDKFFREATSFIPQSTVAIISAKCVCNIQALICEENLDWDFLNEKHDSVLIQVPEEEVKYGAYVLKSFMEQDLVSPRGENFRMKAEVKVGYNWSDESEDNPNGMKEYSFPV